MSFLHFLAYEVLSFHFCNLVCIYICIIFISYNEAVSACRREIGLLQQIDTIPPIGRLAVILVLIHLAREDYVAAEKAFKEWGNCCEAAEVKHPKFKCIKIPTNS